MHPKTPFLAEFTCRIGQILGTGSVFVVESGEPGCESFDRDLEIGIQVDELAQPFREPRQGDFLITPAGLELFYAPIGEIHEIRRMPAA